MITYVLIGVTLVLYYVYRKLRNGYKYWERKGVNGPKPHWIFGNMGILVTKEYGIRAMVSNCYKDYTDKFVGFYVGMQPILQINDPNLCKNILVQDFNSFVNHGFVFSDGPLSQNLFEEVDDNWRILRRGLTPMFSSGKIKNMMPIFNNCIKAYLDHIDGVIVQDDEVEMKHLNTCYTFKTVIATAFGLDVDLVTEDTKELKTMAAKFISPDLRELAVLIDSYVPGLAKMFIRLTSKKTTDYFMNFTKDIVRYREGKQKKRNDFMDIMITMKEEGLLKKKMEDGIAELVVTDELIAAQCAGMTVVALETTSGSLTFMIYEIARNPDIQERCYNEIKQIMDKHNGTLPYESVNELEYLSMVFKETVRKYPNGTELMRECSKEYTFPDTNVTIDRGVKVLIPIYSYQNDPKYFPDPEKFDPERFSPENIDKIQNYTYMPFGEGPRACIGNRFAAVQMIAVIAHLLYRFQLKHNERTPKKITFDPESLSLKSKGDMWLTIKRR